VAVRIRMKKLGRKHRPFYRICAMDIRVPRDGRILEELGTYDPMVSETDARAILKSERIKYWLSVGAQPSDKVGVLIKKYGAEGSHLEAQRLALSRLAQGRRSPLPRPSAHAAAAAAEPAPAEAPAATAEVTEAPAAE
jgi:small subunit ribosomal protein S16